MDAEMFAEGRRMTLAEFRGGEEWKDDHEEGALVCKCFGVDEGMIERAVRANKLTTIEQVTNYTKAGGGCLTCFEAIEGVLAKVNEEMVAEGLLSFDVVDKDHMAERYVYRPAPQKEVADASGLLDQWAAIDAKAKKAQTPTLLYREPELAVRVIREEFNAEYRGVVIDEPAVVAITQAARERLFG